MEPKVMDKIVTSMPGSDRAHIMFIEYVGPDKDGVECVFFASDGVICAEAVEDLHRVGNTWRLRGEILRLSYHSIISHYPTWYKLERAKYNRIVDPEFRTEEEPLRYSDRRSGFEWQYDKMLDKDIAKELDEYLGDKKWIDKFRN